MTRWTKGLCNTLLEPEYKDLRLPFFEIDTKDPDTLALVRASYEVFHFDLMIHPTKMGYHFLSPTLIHKKLWKYWIDQLRSINSKCPMVCMRVQPNKYPNEDTIYHWYHSEASTPNGDTMYNSTRNVKSICNYLNRIWLTDFQGFLTGQPKLVNYKLPEMKELIVP